MSSRLTNESGIEFHNLVVEGRKEFKIVSVLAKGVRLCPRVDVERGTSVIETSTRPFLILFCKTSYAWICNGDSLAT